VVDVQNCFIPGGSLAVPEGDRVVEPLNAYIEAVHAAGGFIAASLDWHPTNHISFRDQGGLWPPHCVQGSEDAEHHPALRLPPDAHIVRKGYDADREAYSAFDGTDLAEALRRRGVRRLLVGGLATDYCVRQTVLDAIAEGFAVWLLLDAVRAVDVRPGDGGRAIAEVRAAGARTLTLANVSGGQSGPQA
ncbi:MAG: isochorismatase family protein, partial [Anaerolineae bacterium]